MIENISSYQLQVPDPAAPLWLGALNPQDPWYALLDWHSQFEITRFLRQRGDHRDEPLLSFVSAFFPTEKLLLVPLNSPTDWLEQCWQQWKKLGQPRLHIFLPEGVARSQVEKLWGDQKNLLSFAETP